MKPFLADADLTLWQGEVLDVLVELPDESIDCVVTSPPYWGLRDYQAEGQIGLERTPELYVARIVEVFGEVRRVLSQRGTLWLNMGDSYASGNRGWYDEDERCQGRGHRRRPRSTGAIKPKDLVMMPARVALALQADGWFLRAECVWAKPNPMPESVTDRPTKSHEFVYLLSRSGRYYYDREAVLEPYEAKTAGTWSRASYDARNEVPAGKHGTYRREYRHPVLHAPPQAETLDPSLPPEAPRGADGRRKTSRVEYREGRQAHEDYANAYGGERWPGAGRNMRSVWTIPVQPYHGAHFAVFPEELPRRCIEAGCPPGGVVLDPFAGSGTTGFVARALGRRAVLVELNPDYCELIAKRTQQLSLLGDEAA